jgi:hypothetical protein
MISDDSSKDIIFYNIFETDKYHYYIWSTTNINVFSVKQS